ncbi:MAG TPA: hypothetical protein VKD69_12995 [Vicinamibacterales bacterium]|nr:hypothetical protein [Vicinamibacterales bacterium]
MNSEIRLQKPSRAGARRALLVIALVGAWTVAFMGLMQDRDGDSASYDANPRIEKKAPQRPQYVFMVERPV